MGLLVLRDPVTGKIERRNLKADEERAIVDASRALVAYSTPPAGAEVTHESDEGRENGWDRDGAIELAKALPPAFADLSDTIIEFAAPEYRQ